MTGIGKKSRLAGNKKINHFCCAHTKANAFRWAADRGAVDQCNISTITKEK
jgi:hypothetical protein